jgi:hypothetical protein
MGQNSNLGRHFLLVLKCYFLLHNYGFLVKNLNFESTVQAKLWLKIDENYVALWVGHNNVKCE